jgi:hypothetical protein
MNIFLLSAPVEDPFSWPNSSLSTSPVGIAANMALNLFTNYFNHVAGTHVDFPAAPELPVPESTPRAIEPSE